MTSIILILMCYTYYGVTPLRVPKLNTEYHVQKGDIYLAMLDSLHRQASSDNVYCSETDFRPLGVLNLYALIYALKQINDRQDLLPNITIGYVYGTLVHML